MAGGGLIWLWQESSAQIIVPSGPATFLDPTQKRKKKKTPQEIEIELGRKARQKEEEDLLMALLELLK